MVTELTIRFSGIFLAALFLYSSTLNADTLPPSFGCEHIMSMELNGQKVWAKKPDPNKTGIKGCFKKALTHLIPIAILRPTYSCSAPQMLRTEVARIQDLKTHSILVPDIVESAPEWIILSDLGATIESLMKKTSSAEERKNLALRAAQALGNLHQKGRWHGRGEIRDMTLTPAGDIGFIDFEETPEGPLSLKQARDFLMFLFSLSEFLDNPKDVASVIHTYQEEAPKESCRLAFVLFKTLAPFIKLLEIAPLGRDGVRLLHAVKLINQAWSPQQ